MFQQCEKNFYFQLFFFCVSFLVVLGFYCFTILFYFFFFMAATPDTHSQRTQINCILSRIQILAQN